MDDQTAIAQLLFEYADRMDAGDLAGVAQLFDGAQMCSSSGSCMEGAELREHLERTTRIFPDGTPRTRHVTTNVVIHVDDSGDVALATSYVTVFHKPDDVAALQPIFAGRYHDEFRRVGGAWRFARRTKIADLMGDLSSHLRTPEFALTARLAGPTSLEQGIRQTLYRYCRGVDRHDFGEAASCFTEDARVHYDEAGSTEGDTATAFLTEQETASGSSPGHRRHEVTNVLIDAGDEVVTSEAYVTIISWKPATSGLAEVIERCRFVDEWRYSDGTWRISRRKHVVELRTVDGRPSEHSEPT